MSKRKLTKQQSRRINRRQDAHTVKATQKSLAASDMDDSNFGAEQEGLVISHYGTQVDVERANERSIVRCHLRANLGSIVTGDHVIWRESETEDKGVVVSVIPRSSELHRPDGYGKLKLIAANISQAFIVIAPEPEPFHNLIDRYLVITEYLGIQPILLINKSDIESQFDILDFLSPYANLGYPICHTSAKQALGLDELESHLNKGVSIFVGQSGVGKSSILQALLPEEELKIGSLSNHIRKGKHTTTHARLYHFDHGGACIDSPGIREFGLWHLEEKEVAQGFVEFRPFIEMCKFRDCKHKNEPSCALIEAVAQGKISAERFKSYQYIVDTLDDVLVRQPEKH